MNSIAHGFVEHILPPIPEDEIARDAVLRQIVGRFGADCQQQMVVGGAQTGKTNLLSQFVRHCRGKCVAYFISPSPLSQRQYAFMYSLCCQLTEILGTTPPAEQIGLEDLRSLLSVLVIKLGVHARAERSHYYYVVDGLERGLVGAEGERIIDLFPLPTSPRSPFLLVSCRSEHVDRLPRNMECKRAELLEFNSLETQEYLSGVGFSEAEIGKAHKKYHGVPGYLRIVKETKRANQGFDVEGAPEELGRLVHDQVESVLAVSSASTLRVLRVLAVSPAYVPTSVLADVAQDEESRMLESLQGTGLVQYDSANHVMEYSNELFQAAVRDSVGDEIESLTNELLDHIKRRSPEDRFLLALLLEQAEDYDGLSTMVSQSAIVNAVSEERDVFGLIRTMRLASEMARRRGETADLLKWTLGIAAVQSFVSHAASPLEIRALTSIGEFNDALARAYAVPEATAKIRSLASVYVSMKEQGQRIPVSARRELSAMVSALDLDTVEIEAVEQLAVHLLPVVPDVALSILEKAIGESQKRSMMDIAIEAIEGVIEQNERGVMASIGEIGAMIERRQRGVDPLPFKVLVGSASVPWVLPSWLSGLPLSRLVDELRLVENTKAKEYVLRQWCKQNVTSPDLSGAIELWLDTVIEDRQFVVLLRSLREISDVIVKAGDVDRATVERVKVPGFTVLESPKQEWVRFRLNLAETIIGFDRDAALEEISRVHETIREEQLDLDIRGLCLARLWGTLLRVFPGQSDDEKGLIPVVEMEFDSCFRQLLDESADQLEPVVPIVESLVDVDPICALTAACEANTYARRMALVRVVLEATLQTRGRQDISDFVRNGLAQLDAAERDGALVKVVSKLRARDTELGPENLEVLLQHSRGVSDPAQRAEALGQLACLFESISPARGLEIMDEAVQSWRTEDDLKIRLGLGFALVERASTLDVDMARELCSEVRALKSQAGSGIASGSLGATYTAVVDLAIRALTLRDFAESDQVLRVLEGLVLKIPCRLVRVRHYAMLAAGAYRVGCHSAAERLVREKVIPEMPRMDSPLDLRVALRNSLPVLCEYDMSTAKSMSAGVSYPAKDEAWYDAVLWCLCRSFLGDHHFEPEVLHAKVGYPRLLRALDAAGEIQCDWLVWGAIAAIASSVRASFDTVIDAMQALDILERLERLASDKLPEPGSKNISHEGYLVVAQAHIHGARSHVFRRAKNKRGLNRKDIRHRWDAICERARRIPNVADRVFVMALVAREMRHYYTEQKASARRLLSDAESQVITIPTLLDRGDRLEAIAGSWDTLGDKTQAQVLLESAFAVASELETASTDERLRLLVQAAHTVSPALADELLSRIDSRLPGDVIHPAGVALRAEKLRADPSGVSKVLSLGEAPGRVLGLTARKLLVDLAADLGTVPATPVLDEWLMRATMQRPVVAMEIAHWVVECMRRKDAGALPPSRVDQLVGAAQLTYSLADCISAGRGESIPVSVHDSFAGLSAKVQSFGPGEGVRAKTWLEGWLRENVEGYLKICDPFFDADQIEYLKHVPLGCRILVVTTDRYLGTDAATVEQDLRSCWRDLSKSALPTVQLLIVPRALEDRFHDRAIVTRGSALHIGPSLKDLGESRGNIAVLADEDARELEQSYVDEMLNNATWFLEGLKPVVVFLGE